MHEQVNRRESERREVEYILGHSPHELRRLILQVEILRPITERLLAAVPQKISVDFATFDLAVGRYVLIHRADPASFIRAAASRVKPGGAVAFHEIALYEQYLSLASVPLWQQAVSSVISALRSVMTHPDAAGRLRAHFP